MLKTAPFLRPRTDRRPWLILSAFATATGLFAQIAPTGDVLQYESSTATGLVKEVRTLSNGTVVKIYCQVGDHVQKGAVLAELDSDTQKYQMDLAKSQLDAEGGLITASGQLDQRKSDLDQMQDLYRKRQASKFQVDSSTAWVMWAEAQLRTLREQRIVLQIHYDYWTQQYNERFMTSPDDGIVSEVKISVGQSVGIAATAFVIKNPRAATFSIVVPADVAATLTTDQIVPVRTPGLRGGPANARLTDILIDPSSDGAKRILKFTIDGIAPEAAKSLGKYNVFLAAPSPDNTPIPAPKANLPDAFATPVPSPPQVH